MAAHARVQEAAHRARLAAFEAIDAHLADHGPAKIAHARATLRMGLLSEAAFVRFWNEIARQPPSAGPPAEERRAQRHRPGLVRPGEE